jgi:DNA-binding MarR family transcriptional regulator
MHKTKVSRAVRALEERRWLKRRESETDRREEVLSLSASGRKAYSDIVPRALAFERRIMSALGSQASPLISALERLEEILEVKEGN